jgi:uncharacterized phage protein gp47/JayE
VSATTTTLCDLPASDGGGCCAQAPAGPTVPATILNAPGLPAIQYRIGTFTSFRRAMLDQVAAPDLMQDGTATFLAADIGPDDTSLQIEDFAAFPVAVPFRIRLGSEYLQVLAGAGSDLWAVLRGVDGSMPAAHAAGDPVLLDPANPFAAWREGTTGDYQTAFIELFAYLADILTFYQERIANEAFLGTATQRDSLLRLADLVDSQPSPGSGATALVAFLAQKGQTVTVPAGLRLGSKASPGKAAAVFETATALAALDVHNRIPVASMLPLDQFAPIAGTIRTIVLARTGNQLGIGDYVVAVANERAPGETARAFRLRSVSTDPVAQTTTISWTEQAGTTYDESRMPVNLYALRVSAAPFGNDAPAYNTLPPWLTHSQTIGIGKATIAALNPITISAVYPDNWDDPKSDHGAFYIPSQDTVFLDTTYDTIKASPEIPGWTLLLSDAPRPAQVTSGVPPSGSPPFASLFHVTGASDVSNTGYTLNTRVTRLVLGGGETVTASIFPLRTTTVLAGTQQLTLQHLLPATAPVAGTSMTLAGLFGHLQAGQTIIVQGPLVDPTGAATETIAAESGVLNGPPVLDAVNRLTTINLVNALTNQYAPAGTVVFANVVAATQGETVHDEVLGSGNGAPFQSFALKKKPLTFLPSAGATSLSALQSTLTVTVNGVAWQEKPDLLGETPAAQVYTISTDDQQQTRVTFGDGVNGAPPPTGVANIRARYRKGLGTSGNVATGAIAQLIDSTPGLSQVTNPQPSAGGADPASSDAIRQTAPATMATFGRAISAPDYAALALQFPGIVKATSVWVIRGPDLKPVRQPYVQLTVATTDGSPIVTSPIATGLRSFLDTHRDPNVLLRILDFTPVYINVALTIDVHDRYPRQATLARVAAALDPTSADGYFSFTHAAPGASVQLSAVYATVQGIAGVRVVLVTTLGRADQPAAPPADIFVRPTEIAFVGNHPADPAKGTLTLTLGTGGFVDS